MFPRWHHMQSATVSRTLGVPIVRAANGGYSGGFDVDGAPVTRTDLFDVTSTIVHVGIASDSKPASSFGANVPWVAALALVFVSTGSWVVTRRAENDREA